MDEGGCTCGSTNCRMVENCWMDEFGYLVENGWMDEVGWVVENGLMDEVGWMDKVGWMVGWIFYNIFKDA